MIFKTLLTGSAALILTAGAALAQTVAITDAKAWTGTSQGTVENATIIVVDGEVAEVRTGAGALPSGAIVVDADGSWVTPGIIAPFSRVGLVEVPAESSTNDTSASSSPYSVALKAADGFNPAASTIPVTRLEGVTRIVVAPGTGDDMFAGKGMIADTSGDTDSILDDDAFVFIRMGEAGANLAGGSRSATWTRLRAALSDARTFPARYLSHDAGDALTRVDAQAFGRQRAGSSSSWSRFGARATSPASSILPARHLSSTWPLSAGTRRGWWPRNSPRRRSR